jgi:hypothetical protein
MYRNLYEDSETNTKPPSPGRSRVAADEESSMRTLGQIAYEAYYKTSYGVSLISGVPLPPWKDQRPEIQEAWEDAALAVVQSRRGGADGASQEET